MGQDFLPPYLSPHTARRTPGGCRMGGVQDGGPPNPGTAQHPQRGYGVGLWVPGGGKWVLCPTKCPLWPTPLLLSLCKTAFFLGGGSHSPTGDTNPTDQWGGPTAVQIQSCGVGGTAAPQTTNKLQGGEEGGGVSSLGPAMSSAAR